MPPWRLENWYLSRRAQVAGFRYNPYDRLDEWGERIRAQAGEVAYAPIGEQIRAMESHYRGLGQAEVLAMAARYHAGYILTEAEYAFPELHRAGSWKIYRIPVPAP